MQRRLKLAPLLQSNIHVASGFQIIIPYLIIRMTSDVQTAQSARKSRASSPLGFEGVFGAELNQNSMMEGFLASLVWVFGLAYV